mmetsp:Transcript_22529/g.57168  ORF Transcript_22529/g.57168 Transcript_22529/m.57168 type:complete len:328 (-) Transcript_22529:243-1226(-)
MLQGAKLDNAGVGWQSERVGEPLQHSVLRGVLRNGHAERGSHRGLHALRKSLGIHQLCSRRSNRREVHDLHVAKWAREEAKQNREDRAVPVEPGDVQVLVGVAEEYGLDGHAGLEGAAFKTEQNATRRSRALRENANLWHLIARFRIAIYLLPRLVAARRVRTPDSDRLCRLDEPREQRDVQVLFCGDETQIRESPVEPQRIQEASVVGCDDGRKRSRRGRAARADEEKAKGPEHKACAHAHDEECRLPHMREVHGVDLGAPRGRKRREDHSDGNGEQEERQADRHEQQAGEEGAEAVGKRRPASVGGRDKWVGHRAPLRLQRLRPA